MSDIDTARLRELAEAAPTIEVVESIPQDGFECYWLRVNGREIGSINGPQCDERDGWAAYIAAVSPDVVTALCDRIESLERTAAAAGRALREANEREAVSHAVVAGALFDLMGWLTSRDEAILLCGRVHAGPAAEALKEWAEMRGLDIRDARVQDWQDAIVVKGAVE